MVETVGEPEELPPVDSWINKVDFRSTAEVKIPERLVDQVIGQERAVEVIRKASEQKRHVMLIGDPGTGKSMLARSMTEMLPREDLQDIIVYHNPEDPNEPKIRVVPAGKGREIVNAQKAEAMQRREQKASMVMTIVFFIIGLSVILSYQWGSATPEFRPDAPNIILFGILVAAIIYIATRYTGHRQENLMVPKLLVSHTPDEMPPFIDATGSHAGALLGDVKHDPFQSGGLETPAHERVESGAIHKAHKGVLFVDEINVLRMESQQSLLTAMQEKKFSIVGQSERSSGAMVKTEAVPCDFILVAAGNLDAVQGMHPALRSRIRGYGYEIYMKSTMPDSEENRLKLVRFVAQEVAKDRKIPHFDRTAVLEILREAQRRAGRRGQLTLRLRELGGLIRVAGDIAQEESTPLVTAKHVLNAKRIARSLEQQVADRMIERGWAHHCHGSPGGHRERGGRERLGPHQEVHGRGHLEPRHPCPVRRLPRGDRGRQRVNLGRHGRHQRPRRGAGQPDRCDDGFPQRPRAGPPGRRGDREDRGRGGTRDPEGRHPPRELEGRPPGGPLPGEDRDCPRGHAERGPRAGARGPQEVRPH